MSATALARLDPKPTRPTPDEPIPTLAGAPGLALLRSATAPVLAQLTTLEKADELRQVSRVVLASMTPATIGQVGVVLEGLALHYPQFRRTPLETNLVVQQWAEDLEGWPADLVAEAARLWRNSPAERFPTPGQLKALCERTWRARQSLGRRAAAYLVEVGEGR